MCRPKKTLFSRPPDHFIRPPFQNFSVPQDPIFASNYEFLRNLQVQKGLKIFGLKPKFLSNFSSYSLKLDKKLSSLRPKKFGGNPFSKPLFNIFGSSSCTLFIKMKVEYPSPLLHIVLLYIHSCSTRNS